jgi:hypothetical protein
MKSDAVVKCYAIQYLHFRFIPTYKLIGHIPLKHISQHQFFENLNKYY